VVVTEVWALLMVGALVLLALAGLAVLADRPRTPRPDPARLWIAAEELVAHAVRIRAEAGRAATVASDTRTAQVAAERARDAAWAAQEAAERHYEQVRRAVAAAREAARQARTGVAAGNSHGSEATAVTGPAAVAAAPPAAATDDVDRGRTLSRAALSAYRRGDISLSQLREVFRLAGDGDPLGGERYRQLDQARVRLMAARREYDRAAVAARRAEQAAWVAEVAARALLEEAVRSAVEADEAIMLAQRHSRRRDRRFGASGRRGGTRERRAVPARRTHQPAGPPPRGGGVG